MRATIGSFAAAAAVIGTATASAADNHVLSLSSAGQHLRVPHSTSLSASSELTVEYWVRVNNTSGFGRIGKTAPSDGQWGLEVVATGTTVMTVHGSGTTGVFQHPLNEWFHLAGTWKRATGEARIYVNGQLLITTSGLDGPMKSTTYPIFIGFQPNFPITQLYGAVDNFRVWTVERSQEEIRGLMYEQLSVSDATGLSGLVLSLSFENGSTDVSPASNHGILEGGASIIVDNSFGLNPDCNDDGIADAQQIARGELPDYNSNRVPDCCESGTPCELGNYPVQWRVEDGGNGHWYAKFARRTETWDAMRLIARSQGGELASVASLEENSFLRVISTGSNVALGGYRLGDRCPGPWVWTDGQPIQFFNWDVGQPDCWPHIFEDVLVMYSSGLWHDYPRSGFFGKWTGAIAEWSADCNGDGIVDYGQILSGQLVDANNNGVPDSCEVNQCPGDITGNGSVNGLDLAAVLGAWGTNGQGEFNADIDGDGIVSGTDLAFVLGGWGPCP